jgi:hypothetical protein
MRRGPVGTVCQARPGSSRTYLFHVANVVPLLQRTNVLHYSIERVVVRVVGDAALRGPLQAQQAE